MTDANTSITATAIPGGPQPAASVPDFSQTSAAAAAPTFADASQTAGNQKAALLAAIAQAGASGARQYQALQQQNAQDKQAALQAAAQREAVVQNMPPALAQQLAGMAGQGFDLNRTLLNDTSQTAAQGMGLLSQAGGNYLTELQQSIPLVQADTQAKIAQLQEAAFEKQQTSPLNSVSEQVTRAGGVQTMADVLRQGASQYEAQNGGTAGAQYQGPDLAGTQMSPHNTNLVPQSKDQLDQAYYDAIDKFNHWNPGTAKSLVAQGTVKTQTAQATLTNKQQVLSAEQFKNVQANIPADQWQAMVGVVDRLVKGGKSAAPDIYKALIAGGASSDEANAAIDWYNKNEKALQNLGGS